MAVRKGLKQPADSARGAEECIPLVICVSGRNQASAKSNVEAEDYWNNNSGFGLGPFGGGRERCTEIFQELRDVKEQLI